MGSEAIAVGVGILAGLAGLAVAVAAVPLLDSFLFGVSPYDPVAFASAAVALTVVGLVASYLPARRTAKVDIVEVLRVE
jgi:putative ABC transport system permease protein